MFSLHCLWFSVRVGVEPCWQGFVKRQSEGLGVSHTQWGSTCDVADGKRGCALRCQEPKQGIWTEAGVCPADSAAQTTPEACAHFWTALQESEHHPCGWVGEGGARREVLGGWPLQKSRDRGTTSLKGFAGQRHQCGRPGLYHLT